MQVLIESSEQLKLTVTARKDLSIKIRSMKYYGNVSAKDGNCFSVNIELSNEMEMPEAKIKTD